MAMIGKKDSYVFTEETLNVAHQNKQTKAASLYLSRLLPFAFMNSQPYRDGAQPALDSKLAIVSFCVLTVGSL